MQIYGKNVAREKLQTKDKIKKYESKTKNSSKTSFQVHTL